MPDAYITKPSKVWIFGGGITGLSAAHELIERGFDVTVVERAEDPRHRGRPALGGIARTQYAWLPLGAKQAAEETPVGIERPSPRVLPMVRPPKLVLLDPNIPDDGDVSLDDDHVRELSAFVERLRRRREWAERGIGLSVTVLTGRRTADRGEGEGRIPAAQIASRFGQRIEQWILDWIKEHPAEGVSLSSPNYQGRIRNAKPGEDDETVAYVTVISEGVVPGEHGFRYFPGFYRHLFDVMRRTVVTASDDPQGARFWKSAQDNLANTEATWLVVKRREKDPAKDPGSEFDLVSFPRRQARSLQQLLTQVQSFLRDLGYSAGDLSRLTLKLFQYMTTSSERRAAEHEDSTWWDFIDGERFTALCRDHMDRGPEVLGAMTAKESDTRTQGNCVVQLLVDQILGRELTDATLNGPTTEAWFDLWYDYLKRQRVEFIEGELLGFRAPRAGERPDVLVPEFRRSDEAETEGLFSADVDHWYLVAVPGSEVMGFGEFSDGVSPGTKVEGLAERFLAAHDALRAASPGADLGARGDMEKSLEWKRRILAEHEAAVRAAGGEPARRVVEARGVGPMRHLTGVQYFFNANVQFGQEHTLYMDSPWRLSSISQTHFWGRLANSVPDYRGIVSVDLGALHHRDRDDDHGVTAWESAPDLIAQRVWAQVGPTVAVDTLRDRNQPWRGGTTGLFGAVDGGDANVAQVDVTQSAPWAQRGRVNPRRAAHPITARGGETLRPMAYHIDANIEFERDERGAEVRVARNRAPYLINRPGEFRMRPGALRDDATRTRGYDPQNHRWLLAGTFMQTFTRLTTMEAANESARHAVNAVLHARQVQGDRCMIWDPEECEIPDLLPLREVDRRLFLDGYPHMVEILGLEELPDALLPTPKDHGDP